MKELALLFVLLVLQLPAFAQKGTARPRIVGIDHVCFYTTAPEGVERLYGEILGLSDAEPVEKGNKLRYMVGRQWVGFSPAPDPKATDRMDHIALATDNIVAMHRYLIEQGLKPSEIEGRSDHSLAFRVEDPERHRIQFVERGNTEIRSTPSAVSRHMIHAGFVVHRRDAEDHFYRDILGFHLYWHGHMKAEGPDDWVSMQVPDGTDWIEYMLNQPAHIDLQTSGIMNHISLGVASMESAQQLMEGHGWKPHGEERAQMGKDGKWQLNIYDPDLTRVELMEFKPVQKPCCSEFSGTHPSE